MPYDFLIAYAANVLVIITGVGVCIGYVVRSIKTKKAEPKKAQP